MKAFKKILSAVLAASMAMAMMVGGASAATSNLTINTKAGHTYTIYQMVTGDVVMTTTNGVGTISNVQAGANLKYTVTDAEGNTVAEPTAEQVAAAKAAAATAFVADVKDESDSALGDTAYTYVTGTGTEVVGTGSAVVTPVTDGYYVVTDKWTESASQSETLSRYMVAVVGATEMTPKDTSVTTDKIIVDTDANKPVDTGSKIDTAAIGDTINYQITGNVPNMEGYKYFYYIFNDTMESGLTLDANSFVVKIGNNTISADNYTVATGDAANGYTFQLAFNNLKALVAAYNSDENTDNDIAVDDTITVTYNATVNENATVGYNSNDNTESVTFSNNPGQSSSGNPDNPSNPPENPNTPPTDGTNPTGKTPDHTTNTYVTELTILKIDGAEGKYVEALAGAEFTLTGTNLNKVIISTSVVYTADANGSYYKLTADNSYTQTAPTEDTASLYEKNDDGNYVTYTPSVVTETTDESTGAKTVVGTVDAATGVLTFTGLNAGTYTLTETNTPAGYNTCSPLTFTLTGAMKDGAFNWSSNNANVTESNGVFDTTVENNQGNVLPTTGGMGTTLFYVAGGILVAAAGILLITKKRMAH